MGLFGTALLGLFATVIAYGELFLMDYITFVPQKYVSLAFLVMAFIFFIITLIYKRKNGNWFTYVLFLIAYPMLGAVMMQSFGVANAFQTQPLPHTLFAIGGALVLILIFLIILNAMDADHFFAFLLAFVFFAGIIVGLHFVTEMLISLAFAKTFSTCAIVYVIAMYYAMDYN